jgi:hypothetical protein
VVRLYTGPTVPDVMSAWTRLQGRTAQPPAWAVEGVWLGVQGGPAPVRAAVRGRGASMSRWRRCGRRTGWAGGSSARATWACATAGASTRAGTPTSPGSSASSTPGACASSATSTPSSCPSRTSTPAVREGYIVARSERDARGVPISVLSGGVVDVNNPAAVRWFQGYAGRAHRPGDHRLDARLRRVAARTTPCCPTGATRPRAQPLPRALAAGGARGARGPSPRRRLDHALALWVAAHRAGVAGGVGGRPGGHLGRATTG